MDTFFHILNLQREDNLYIMDMMPGPKVSFINYGGSTVVLYTSMHCIVLHITLMIMAHTHHTVEYNYCIISYNIIFID